MSTKTVKRKVTDEDKKAKKKVEKKRKPEEPKEEPKDERDDMHIVGDDRAGDDKHVGDERQNDDKKEEGSALSSAQKKREEEGDDFFSGGDDAAMEREKKEKQDKEAAKKAALEEQKRMEDAETEQKRRAIEERARSFDPADPAKDVPGMDDLKNNPAYLANVKVIAKPYNVKQGTHAGRKSISLGTKMDFIAKVFPPAVKLLKMWLWPAGQSGNPEKIAKMISKPQKEREMFEFDCQQMLVCLVEPKVYSSHKYWKEVWHPDIVDAIFNTEVRHKIHRAWAEDWGTKWAKHKKEYPDAKIEVFRRDKFMDKFNDPFLPCKDDNKDPDIAGQDDIPSDSEAFIITFTAPNYLKIYPGQDPVKVLAEQPEFVRKLVESHPRYNYIFHAFGRIPNILPIANANGESLYGRGENGELRIPSVPAGTMVIPPCDLHYVLESEGKCGVKYLMTGITVLHRETSISKPLPMLNLKLPQSQLATGLEWVTETKVGQSTLIPEILPPVRLALPAPPEAAAPSTTTIEEVE